MNLLTPEPEGRVRGVRVVGQAGARGRRPARRGLQRLGREGGLLHPHAPIRRDRGPPETRYLHVTTNETIGGIRMVDMPEVGVPLVADMSSDYLSRPIDWRLYDLVYGGVQKNLAPAGNVGGLCPQGRSRQRPQWISVRSSATRGMPRPRSLGHTPPMFSIYIMGKVLARMKADGGITRRRKGRGRQSCAHIRGHRRERRLLPKPRRPGRSGHT